MLWEQIKGIEVADMLDATLLLLLWVFGHVLQGGQTELTHKSDKHQLYHKTSNQGKTYVNVTYDSLLSYSVNCNGIYISLYIPGPYLAGGRGAAAPLGNHGKKCPFCEQVPFFWCQIIIISRVPFWTLDCPPCNFRLRMAMHTKELRQGFVLFICL